MIEFLDQNAVLVIIVILLLILIEIGISILLKSNKTKEKGKLSEGTDPVLKELSKHSPVVSVLFEKGSHKVVFVSDNIEQIMHIKKERVYGDLNVLETLLDKKERWRLQKIFEEQSLDNGESMEETTMQLPDHTEASTIKLTYTPTWDEKYVLMTFEDISEEQKVRENLKEQIAEVQAIDESKTQFLSKMSHEIRTPMNGMLGMISLAKISQKKNEYEEANEYLNKAEGLTQFLLSIINDILDMSRIESGKMELEKAEFSIVELSEKLRSMFETTLSDKGIAFNVEMRDFTVENVIGDELRISQVLTNFLSNASKFTSSGGHISLIMRQMEIFSGKVSIMLRVKDDGIGMPQEFLSRIFKPFEQQDSGTARKFGGSGLGMAIADNLVREMGGQILVDSELGKGTEFTVFLDLPLGTEVHKTNTNTQNHTEEISIDGRRLLMAEDNEINAMVACELLGLQGLIMERVENGQEAVETFNSHDPGYYDAILMDIHMPVMDGWEATRTLRALDRPDAATIPIIALSADAFAEDKRHSIEVGMNDHVAKPIDYDELKRVLCECLAKQ